MTTLGHDIRELLHEQVVYRELLAQMIKRDLLLRYKQTVMGFGWAIFMPLVNTAMFSVIFTRVAPIDTGVPYPLFAYCGLLVWNFLPRRCGSRWPRSPATPAWSPRCTSPGRSFRSRRSLSAGGLRRGRVVLVADDGVVSRRARRRCALAAGGPAGRTSRSRRPSALLLAMANLFYRDVKYLFEIVLTVWMFATSVVYPVRARRRTPGCVAAVSTR